MAWVAVLGSALAIWWSQGADATRLPVHAPPVHATLIPCYEPTVIRRYVGKSEPSSCDIGGIVKRAVYVAQGTPERLGKGGAFVTFPLGGGFEWESWGGASSHGFGVDSPKGREGQVTVYRRVRCADGTTWYARANVFKDEGILFQLRLPVCGHPATNQNRWHRVDRRRSD